MLTIKSLVSISDHILNVLKYLSLILPAFFFFFIITHIGRVGYTCRFNPITSYLRGKWVSELITGKKKWPHITQKLKIFNVMITQNLKGRILSRVKLEGQGNPR